MKKLLVMLTLGVVITGMTACGNKDNAGQSTEPTQIMESSVVETGTASTENTGTAAAGSTEETATEGQTEYIDVTNGWSEEMTALKQAVVDTLGENYWPNAQILPEMLEMGYGITPDMYDDYMGEAPMISANVDTLLIIRAKDDKVNEVEEALNAHREMLVNDTLQYPMNIGKIQASRIQTYGNYVCFVQLGADVTEVSESGDEAVIEHCQEQNELALEVIGHSIAQ